MGVVLTSEFHAEVGDLTRYPTGDSLAAPSAMAPTIRQSGTADGRAGRPAANPRLKRVFYQSAICALNNDQTSKAFSAQESSEDKTHRQPPPLDGVGTHAGTWLHGSTSVGTTALLGPSGAGKTTTALLAVGVHRPTRGRVMIDELDLADLAPAARHQAVGMVTQDVFVLHASLRANLTLAKPEATDVQIMEALRHAQLGALIDTLPQGLDTTVGDRGFRLSGGERQRLSLARIFLSYPDIVILDEATAHLDALTEAALHDAMTHHLAGHTS